MVISIKAQQLKDLFHEGRELIIIVERDEGFYESYRAECVGYDYYGPYKKTRLYDMAITDPFDSGESGSTRLSEDTPCMPVVEDILKTNPAGGFRLPFCSLVLAHFDFGFYFFGESDERADGGLLVLHPDNYQKTRTESFFWIDPEKVELAYSYLEGEEKHEDIHSIPFAKGKRLLVKL